MHNTLRIGVVGKGGLGKTLLLKRLFNRVKNLFSKDLLLWVTVSSTPSFPSLRSQFYEQISSKLNNERPRRESEEEVKKWVYEKLSEKKFTLFLDDVWETSAALLLEELCVPLPSAEAQRRNLIIASSRSHRALQQLGIPTPSPAIVDMQSLMEHDSWKLFSYHAFPHNNGNLPESITENVARNVCKECGDLPLAIKVIGRAMSAVTHLQEWEFTLRRLQNAEPINTADDVQEYLYDRLRLSYDSLADFHVSLQLCFLYLAVFPEDEIINAHSVSLYWIGEGLLKGDNVHGTAQTYINLLADRCLVEVVFKDVDGHVTDFRVHDVLHDLARRIGRTEENCFFGAGTGLKDFPEFGAHFRISLLGNEITSAPNSLRGPHIRSLIMARNIDLKAIPTKVIASMTSLQILDLSGTSLQSLPKSIGGLKHLISLHLREVPIKRLPNTITSLNMLQVLDLYGSSIRELPSSIHRLSSLRILDIRFYQDLWPCIPQGITKLKSLEELRFGALDSIFSLRTSINDSSAFKHLKRLRLFKNGEGGASVNGLRALKHLKKLWLFNYGETIQDGTLGIMIDMKELLLELTMMESLPQDIIAMSKLRVLTLVCPHLTRLDDSVCRFQQLSTLTLCWCRALKQLPDLHKIVSLKQLDISGCHEIEELPKEFGERGSFPKLEVLNLLGLDTLGELPEVDEAAMPSLQTLSILRCRALKTLPEGYWNLRSLKKIGIYDCLRDLQNLQDGGNVTEQNRKVQLIITPLSEFRKGEFWQTLSIR